MAKKKTLKILMFNRWVGYNEGGHETSIKELSLFLSRKGHKVDILTTGDSALTSLKPYLNRIIPVQSPQEYFIYSPKKLIFTLEYITGSIKAFHRLIAVEKEKYDVVVTHFSLEAFIMRFIRLIYGVPYVLILGGDTDLELIEGKRADNVSQITHYMAKECVPYGYYPEILMKGVDEERFNTSIDGSIVRKRYITKKNQFLIVTVCRLDPRKNLQTLVKAASILNNKLKNTFKFVIVGGGVEEKKLKNLAKRLKLQNTVYFTGALQSTSVDLPKHYAAADIFALPTLYEGFGYVYSEAMAFGLPVIGTDTSAVPEVLEGTGVIVPLKSPSKLADAILSIYHDLTLREKLSEQSLKTVEQWYWSNLIDRYEDFIFTAIRKFNKHASPIKRLYAFISEFLLDLPKIIFIGLRPLVGLTVRHGSVLRKEA